MSITHSFTIFFPNKVNAQNVCPNIIRIIYLKNVRSIFFFFIFHIEALNITMQKYMFLENFVSIISMGLKTELTTTEMNGHGMPKALTR